MSTTDSLKRKPTPLLRHSMFSGTWIVRLYSDSDPRKDKPIGNTFGEGFSWSEAIDAVADIYNGVSSSANYCDENVC